MTAVYCVACDAHRIVSGSADATIRVWNVRTNATWSVQTLRGHSDAVRCLQLLPLTPSLLSSASALTTTYLSTSSSPSSAFAYPPSSSQSSSSCSSSSMCPNPSNFFACYSNSSPAVIDSKQPPEALLISGSSDRTIKLWRLSSNTNWSRIACVRTLIGHMDTVRCLQVSSTYIGFHVLSHFLKFDSELSQFVVPKSKHSGLHESHSLICQGMFSQQNICAACDAHKLSARVCECIYVCHI